MRVRPVRVGRKWRALAISAAVVMASGGFLAVEASASSSPLFLITPKALTFGYVPIGSTTAAQKITIKNVSGVPQTMSGTGGGAGVFGGSQNCEGTTLAPGKSCQMSYAFSPTSKGTVHGTTNGTWNGQAFNLTFTGTGIPEFLITPTSLLFGQVTVGTTSPSQAVQITNESNQSVVMSGAGGGAGVFGGSQNCQGATLAPGKSCQMSYAFSPTSNGTVNGSTNGSWNGQAFALKFKGTGTP